MTDYDRKSAEVMQAFAALNKKDEDYGDKLGKVIEDMAALNTMDRVTSPPKPVKPPASTGDFLLGLFVMVAVVLLVVYEIAHTSSHIH